MLFNSIEFLFFLPTVFILYWFVFKNSIKSQNLLILLSSYIFYGWWDYRFLSLIFLSTCVDYFIGLNIANERSLRKKKLFLWSSIIFNLSALGFFKYYNFFVDSWVDLLNTFGYEITSKWTLNIILPVGISFYTFQTMSYTIDIYNEKLKPTKDFISFAAFVSFFPQLVAGPIERASNLIPQILNNRKFSYIQGLKGIRLIIYGMFKKVVIADSLSPVIDNIFLNPQEYGGGTLFLGALYFSFQIYCDFSGYSDIAIGTSKLFGIDLMPNFNFPYFSRNIGEFWRKWHISLSTWFRDYLYIPIGGSKKGKTITIRNIFIIFIVSGFWHGAKWTFLFWGLFHAILFIPTFIFKTNRKYISSEVGEKNFLPTINELIQIVITFSLVTIGWVFFRSSNLLNSLKYLKGLTIGYNKELVFEIMLIRFILPFLILEYILFKGKFQKNDIKSFLFYGVIFVVTFIFFVENQFNNFIYFQF